MDESRYYIPADVDELFTNGKAQYEIYDWDQAGDNVFAINLFLECVNVPDEMIEECEGTQVILNDGVTRLCIDSGGLGDFYHHGYDVTVLLE